MTTRQRSALRLVGYLLMFLLIWGMVLYLPDALGKEQPPMKDIEWLLTPDGQVYSGQDEGLIFPFGQWSGQTLATNRGVRGNVLVFRVVAADGEDLLFVFTIPPPARSGRGEGFDLAVTEFPGSFWIPLSGVAKGWQLDNGRMRIIVRVYARS